MCNSEEWQEYYPNQEVVINKEFVDVFNKESIKAAKDFVYSKNDNFKLLPEMDN